MHSIQFKNVSKSYGKNTVIRELNMLINARERFILLGPSGCGKSTILRLIAGLEDVSQGELFLGGKCVNELPPGDRNVAMVFQNYALFPHMTVYDNVAFGLRTRKLSKQEEKQQVNDMLSLLNLDGLEKRKPQALSGGQRQRVALARAAVKRAPYFLLDEPLSNLDAQLRLQARNELIKLHDLYQPTFVYVTHDQIEAMTLGTRVVVLNRGEIQMIDTPQNVYHRPRNMFTAKFIGSPSMNILRANLADQQIILENQRILLSSQWRMVLKGQSELFLGIRPEHVTLSDIPRENAIKLNIQYAENQGAQQVVFATIGHQQIIAIVDNQRHITPGQSLYWLVNEESLSFFDPATEENLGYPSPLKDLSEPVIPQMVGAQ